MQGILVMSARPLDNREALLQQILDQQKAQGHSFAPNFIGSAQVGDWNDQAYVYASILTAFSAFGGADLIDRTRAFSFQAPDGNEGKYFVLFDRVADSPGGDPAAAVAEGGRELARRKAFLEETLGNDVSAKLIDHLGIEGAATFAETAVAEAQARWSHRNDENFLTEEERQEMHRKAREAGTDTIKARAAFFVRFEAEKVAGEVASEAMKKANLPEDRDLHLDVAARIYLSLD